VTVFFYGEDDMRFEFVAEDFADFCKAGFYFFANGWSYFVVPAGVFHVH
jgi:hypothetical protein